MKRSVLAIVLSCVLLLTSGCAKDNYGPKTTPVAYYPACYQPIQELRDSGDKTTQYTAIGAVSGAAVGALLGGLAGRNTTGVLVGAGAGALAGGLLGYAKAKQDSIKDARARYASYVGDIQGEAGKLDQVTLAGKASRACYEQSFDALVAQYKAKQISREEYKARYDEIRAGMQEASRILGQAYGAGQEKDKEFQAALDDEAQKAGTSAEAVKKKQLAASEKAQRAAAKKNKTAAKPGDKTQPAPAQADSNLAGLDENSLEAVSASTDRYDTSIEAVRMEQAAVDTQLQRMETVDAGLGNEVI
jgi:outer membrane lipoprotein SlyB